MTYDPKPGGLDGPPRKKSGFGLPELLGVLILGLPIVAAILAFAWCIAWLLVHWPT